jgi:hypothetical protein
VLGAVSTPMAGRLLMLAYDTLPFSTRTAP